MTITLHHTDHEQIKRNLFALVSVGDLYFVPSKQTNGGRVQVDDSYQNKIRILEI